MKLGARIWLTQTLHPQSLGKIQSAKQKGEMSIHHPAWPQTSAHINKIGTQGNNNHAYII